MTTRVPHAFMAALIVGGTALAALTQTSAQQATQPTPVAVAVAKMVQMSPSMALPGTVVARSDSHIAAQAEGTVISIAQVGDILKKGDVIARLDTRLQKMQFSSDSANVSRLRASLKFDQLQLGRMERLARAQAISASERDQAVATRDIDKAQLAQAIADLSKSSFALDQSEIRAPFPGRVAARLINPGEYATIGKDIVRLVDIEDVEISAPAPIAASHYLHPGLPVVVEVEKRRVSATVRAIVPVGDVFSRTVEVRFTIAARDGLVGDAAKVFAPAAAARNVLAIPRDALVLREDNTYVFRIASNNVADRVAIETGMEDGALVEVLGNLSAGDRVVVRGAERLEPGQKVRATSGWPGQ